MFRTGGPLRIIWVNLVGKPVTQTANFSQSVANIDYACRLINRINFKELQRSFSRINALVLNLGETCHTQ